MLKRVLLSFCIAGILAPFAAAQTVDEVIARYLAARGGAEKLRAVKSERLSGALSAGTDAGSPFTVEFKRPSKMHMEIKFPGQAITRIFDGKSGWLTVASGEEAESQEMSAAEINNVSKEADVFDGPLVNYQARGIKVELGGHETAGESDTLKLEVTFPDGTRDTYFIDAKTNLPVKWEGQRTANGKPVVYESWFRSYLVVDGLKFANVIESGVKGDPKGPGQKLTLEKVELNVAVDDARFAKPAAVKK